MWANEGMYATVFILLFVGHQVADYWLQTRWQVDTKAKSGWYGRWACAQHVVVLSWTQGLLLAGASWLFGMDLDPRWALAGLGLNAATHYLADRRTPLIRLADALQRWNLVAGKGDFARAGDPTAAPCGTGAHALDQSWHHLWLALAAFVCVIGPGWNPLTLT